MEVLHRKCNNLENLKVLKNHHFCHLCWADIVEELLKFTRSEPRFLLTLCHADDVKSSYWQCSVERVHLQELSFIWNEEKNQWAKIKMQNPSSSLIIVGPIKYHPIHGCLIFGLFDQPRWYVFRKCMVFKRLWWRRMDRRWKIVQYSCRRETKIIKLLASMLTLKPELFATGCSFGTR